MEVFAKKSASTDGRLCKKSALCVQYMTEWRKEGTSFLYSQNSLLKVDQEKRTRRDFSLYCLRDTECKRNGLNDELFSYQGGSQD